MQKHKMTGMMQQQRRRKAGKKSKGQRSKAYAALRQATKQDLALQARK